MRVPAHSRTWAAVVVIAAVVAACSSSSSSSDKLQDKVLTAADLQGQLAVSVFGPTTASQNWHSLTDPPPGMEGTGAPWPCSALTTTPPPLLEADAEIAAMSAEEPDGWSMRQWLLRPADPDIYEAQWRAVFDACATTLNGTTSPPGYGLFAEVDTPGVSDPSTLAYRRSFGVDDPDPDDYVLVRIRDFIAIYDRGCYDCHNPRAAPPGRLDDAFAAFVEAGNAKLTGTD